MRELGHEVFHRCTPAPVARAALARRRRILRSASILALIAGVATVVSVSAETADSLLSARDLKGLPLEQLFDVSVTLVSKRPEKLSETPSAIQVITAEDIRHSGATHLADALRLAPNVEVQQINSYAVAGGPNFHAEKLVAYETGYRLRPRPALSLATFYNHDDDLYSVELEHPPQALPYTIQNGVAGQSWGIEVSGLFQSLSWWRLRGGGTFFRKNLWSRPGHDVLPRVIASLGNDPNNQALLQSMISAGADVECDATLRYIDRLSSPRVPSDVAVDARLGMRKSPVGIVVGQNLTDKAHPEFRAAQEVPRSFYVTLAFRR